MDSSFTIKPRDSVSRALHDRASTVRTDLSPSQSVRAAEAVAPLRNGQSPADLTPRSVTIDPGSQDVIHRARDEEDRRRRQKLSDEALSRMRAYRKPAQEAGPEPDHPHADIEV
jgi:hypothetical protein